MHEKNFEAELCQLRPTLFYYTRRFTTDREAGRDLVQDTILKALLYKSRFREDVNLKGWLFTIMRNTYINQYNKESKFKKLEGESAVHTYLSVEETHTFNNPESNIRWKDTWNAIDQLNDDLGRPFKMYTSGYKYEEIAKHLKLPLGTVKNRIFHARLEIQKRLAR